MMTKLHAFDDHTGLAALDEDGKSFMKLASILEEPFYVQKKSPVCQFERVHRYNYPAEPINPPTPTQMYHQIIPPKPKELRIMVLGDCIAMGASSFPGATYTTPYQHYKSDQSDGTLGGFEGWTYFMHNHLKEKKAFDPSLEVTILDYGAPAATVLRKPQKDRQVINRFGKWEKSEQGMNLY